ncbi:hypothetical protein [Neobacillus cucumis]|uniref:hypothetical protein n=1 Tax=Neobacillus cucumis TaxID=1740721 RepID=UPI0027E217A6|nr:hypothetical protein [Neobacillus cucumis]
MMGGNNTSRKTLHGENRCDASFRQNDRLGWLLATRIFLEMPERLITTRLIASTGGINRSKMRDPKRMLS